MRIPDLKITDEKTKAALVGYATLLTKDQSRVVTARLAEVGEALENGDVGTARERCRGAAMALMTIVKGIDHAADLLGIEDLPTPKVGFPKECLLKEASFPY